MEPSLAAAAGSTRVVPSGSYYHLQVTDGEMAKTGSDDVITKSMVYELLDLQKSYFKDLMDQQEKSFKACLQIFVDSTVSRVDNLVRNVATMSRSVDDLKASLQFSQAELDSLKISTSKCMEAGKTISERLSASQTSIKDVSAKLDYLENQSRRNNMIIDGIPDVKSESWSDQSKKYDH